MWITMGQSFYDWVRILPSQYPLIKTWEIPNFPDKFWITDFRESLGVLRNKEEWEKNLKISQALSVEKENEISIVWNEWETSIDRMKIYVWRKAIIILDFSWKDQKIYWYEKQYSYEKNWSWILLPREKEPSNGDDNTQSIVKDNITFKLLEPQNFDSEYLKNWYNQWIEIAWDLLWTLDVPWENLNDQIVKIISQLSEDSIAAYNQYKSENNH